MLSNFFKRRAGEDHVTPFLVGVGKKRLHDGIIRAVNADQAWREIGECAQLRSQVQRLEGRVLRPLIELLWKVLYAYAIEQQIAVAVPRQIMGQRMLEFRHFQPSL